MSNRLDAVIEEKLEKYQPKGGLKETARLFLANMKINHQSTERHLKRVALLSSESARILKKDELAAFFGGLLHDFGKGLLPHSLFEEKEITKDEYEKIKEHSRIGFEALKDKHLFTALCVGSHHGVYKNGYGITAKDFPVECSPSLMKKVLEISTIVSICDFINAYSTRKTKTKDDSGKLNLKEALLNKYPDDILVIEAILVAKESLGLYK